MVSVKEVPADKFVNRLKEELKRVNGMEPAPFAGLIKSGTHKARPPEQDDFWYVRAASIIRRISVDDKAGVSRLRTYYGGRKKRGCRPPRFRKAGGSLIRRSLQKLEAAGLLEKSTNKKGRKLTKEGQKLVSRIAHEVSKE